METGVKYLLSKSTFQTTKNERSPFYIKLLIQMCAGHISCPSNMGFARQDPGLWEMANWILSVISFS